MNIQEQNFKRAGIFIHALLVCALALICIGGIIDDLINDTSIYSQFDNANIEQSKLLFGKCAAFANFAYAATLFWLRKYKLAAFATTMSCLYVYYFIYRDFWAAHY